MQAYFSPTHPEKSRLWAFMRFAEEKTAQVFKDYQALYAWSIAEPASFWLLLSDFFNLNFNISPDKVLNSHQTMLEARWFEGARFNFAQKLLNGQDEHPALIGYDEQGKREVLSYGALKQAVALCALSLKQTGLKPKDRVAAILPNVSYTVIIMLATAALGGIFASISPDFGLEATLDRLTQITPKFLFIGNGHQYAGKRYEEKAKIENLCQAIRSLSRCIVCPILEDYQESYQAHHIQSWQNFIEKVQDKSENLSFEAFPFEHPLYILFSSGTTGKPKCIVHGAGGTLLQHLKELALHTDLEAHDIVCFYTTCAWMMWNWMVSGLALGLSLVLYDGAPHHPTPTHLLQILSDEKVTVFGTSAKYLAYLEKEAALPSIEPTCTHPFNLNSLKTILSTGSPLLPEQYDFIAQHIKSGVQVSSVSGGTDIISCFALGNPLLPVYAGQLQCLGLGMAVAVFNQQGKSVKAAQGELVCYQAFPSMPLYFWQDQDKKAYHKAYFERFAGVWAHGDFAEITPEQGLIIYGRSDATLNPGGIRIGTAEIYRQLENIPEIIDAVVIGQCWQEDVRIVLFVKLRKGLTLDAALKKHICQNIREHASPRHVPAKILQVADIPRTLNGKLVELAIKQVVQGRAIENLGAIANPEALVYFQNRKELQN